MYFTKKAYLGLGATKRSSIQERKASANFVKKINERREGRGACIFEKDHYSSKGKVLVLK